MTSWISYLVHLPGFSTWILSHHTGMRDRFFSTSKGIHILKKVLPWKPAYNITLLIPFSIQECKMWDTLNTKLIKLLFPLCVVNIQHNKIHTIPELIWRTILNYEG